MRWRIASIGLALIFAVIVLWLRPWFAPRAAIPPPSASPIPTLSGAPATVSPFAVARALAAAGFNTEAAAEAQAALKAHPDVPLPEDLRYLAATSPAPRPSSPVSTDSPFAVTRALAAAGFDAEAATQAKEALKAHPDLPLPEDLRYLAATSPAPRPSSPVGTDSPFGVTRALAAAGFDAEAATQAKEALKAHPDLPLPEDLRYLTQTTPSRDPFAVAKAQVAAGLDAVAIETAKEALKTHPDAAMPPELKRLFDDPFVAARGLAAAGFEKEAGDSLREALKAKPNASVPPELAYLVGQPIRGLLDIENPWTRLTYAITALVALMALVVVAWLLLSRVTGAKLRIQSFDGPSTDSSVGSAVATLVVDELAQLRREGGGRSLIFVASADQQVNVPELLKSLPAQFSIAGVVASMANLVPANLTVLTGRLHPAGDQGLGITATIARPYGGKTATKTLWEKDIDPDFVRGKTTDGKSADKGVEAATYYRLAVSTAAWGLYEIPLDKAAYAAARVMTADSQSYQFFRAGALWHRAGGDRGTSRARRLYVDALNIDPRNTGALLNLALLDSGERKYDRAIQRLIFCRTQIESKSWQANRRPQRDRMWYRATYSLGAALFHSYLGSGSAAALRDAARYAKELVLTALDELARVESADGEIRSFLRLAELSTVVLLADVWTYRVRKGIGASGTTAATALGQSPDNEGLKLVLNDGPSLPGAGYLIRVAESEGGVSYRVHYNLACYYSGRRDYDRSLHHLRYGLEHGNLGAWARRDPALRDLRRVRMREFDKVVRESGDSAESAIAGLSLVGAELAARLDDDERHITSLAELQPALKTKGRRAKFATHFHLDPLAVKQIWEVAELAGVRGIGQANATLLADAGITSIGALESRAPAAVVALLHNVAKLRPTSTEPTLDEVAAWIDEARRSPASAA